MVAALLAVSGDEPAPSWIPIVALAVPLAIVLAVLIPGLKKRRKYKVAMASSAAGVQEESVATGSAEEITDGGTYSVAALRKALAIKPEDHGPAGGEPHDEGWAGTMLGLKSKISTATELLEPHVYWGERERGQVFVRVGPDEKIAGGTEIFSNKHIRQLTVLRVAAPTFKLRGKDGRPVIAQGMSADLQWVLERIGQSPAAWTDMAAQAGPEGIVFERPSTTAPEFWIYDLWLAEAIARALDLPALPDARIGPAWTIPYDVGRNKIDLP